MEENASVGFAGILGAIGDGLVALFTGIAMAFYNVAYAVMNPGLWLGWLTWDNSTEDKQSLMRCFGYYP